jgi:hypothetical protein
MRKAAPANRGGQDVAVFDNRYGLGTSARTSRVGFRRIGGRFAIGGRGNFGGFSGAGWPGSRDERPVGA